MHAPQGHALMGWVAYPPHMGPHFVGPIVGAQRAPQKKKKKVRWGHPCEPTEQNNQANQPREHVRE